MKNAKLAVLNEWDVHLRTVHPRQWEREQRKEDERNRDFATVAGALPSGLLR